MNKNAIYTFEIPVRQRSGSMLPSYTNNAINNEWIMVKWSLNGSCIFRFLIINNYGWPFRAFYCHKFVTIVAFSTFKSSFGTNQYIIRKRDIRFKD